MHFIEKDLKLFEYSYNYIFLTNNIICYISKNLFDFTFMRTRFSVLLILVSILSFQMNAQFRALQKTEKSNNTSQTKKVSGVSLEELIKTLNNDYVITSEHVSSISGIRHIYLRQAIEGLEVVGTESSIHLDTNGHVIATHNNFVENIQSTLGSSAASISDEQAIVKVAQQMNYQIGDLQKLESKENINKESLFNNAGISERDIPVKMMYYYRDGIGSTLVWELSIMEIDSSDWWNFRVDASSGNIIDKDNWTVSCNIMDDHNDHVHINNSEKKTLYNTVESKLAETTPNMVVGAYRVYALPVESPNHGGRTLESNPDDPTASPFGWHDTNGASGNEYTYTRGNNVMAYDDDNANNAPDGKYAYSPGGNMIFDFSINTSYSSGNQSEDAAITNLFYWNNIIHDVTYQYGFTEAAGNFQENNYGNGGAGSDSVNAEAQDGSGTCNANFGTPSDGGNPRMQMYVCGSRDGDLDNGVIIHEYGHGISNRLTGGPAASTCLNNTEQMGEGWSDYYALVMTIEPGDAGTDPRGMGTWLIGESASGAGIRSQRYDTDDNTYSYNSIKTEAVPHGVGSVWAMMLWEMTWDLINVYGFDADIYNGTGGNNVALALVTEGMKLQPCSPGFVDGRDAILAADQALYGGANQCTIWIAFARRGLGYSANQGSTGSKTDGTEAYDLPPGTALFDTLVDTLCITEGIQTGLTGGAPVGGVYSGSGVTDDGNGSTYSFDPSIAGVGTATVIYTVNDACSGGVVNLNDTIEITDGNPVLICKNVTVTLDGSGNATITQDDVVDNMIPGSYAVDQTGTFAPESITGTSVNLADDNGSSALPIGFDFDFYGISYSNFYIASNGFISFNGSGMNYPQSSSVTAIPSTGVPNNMIAVIWDDLDPSVSGTIRYETIGTAPNRKLVVEYFNIPLYGTPSRYVTTQLQLHEGTHRIEIHTTEAENQSSNANRTQGLENSDGTEAIITPGRNNTNWTLTNDYVAFYRLAGTFADNCGNSVSLSLSDSAFTCQDIGDNVITVTASDGNGGVSTCFATVTVSGNQTVFNGSSWSGGTPTLGSAARFSGDYNTAAFGDINACSCEIDGGAQVVIGANNYLNVSGNITVDGTLIVEHQGSVVQVDGSAIVTNNGTINVELTTPVLQTRDFMVMGSPMDSETRDGVFNAAFLVLDHTPTNFLPHPEVPAGGTNFADDNGDFWNAYTGPINVGEGYIVRPQSGYTDPANTYYMTYTQGTLNNGNISRPIVYNASGNPDGTPNVLSNPYASAIDADAFMAGNSLGELYFWEHLTPPSAGIPGYGSINFSMGDVSIYNLTGGVPAANDSGITTTPNGVISTGQGFAVRASAAGSVTFDNTMRLTTGNTTLRRPSNDIDRIWLNVNHTEYGIGSNVLIAFNPEATPEIDLGYDSDRMATAISLYSHLLDGSEQLSIQTREAFDSSIKIPMGFASQVKDEVSYRISISNLEGASISSATVYLVDNQEELLHNLSSDDYEFISGEGTFNQRFTLMFEPEVILGTSEYDLDRITLFPNPTKDIINIVSPAAAIMRVDVFDVMGRLVKQERTINNSRYELDFSSLETAIYFVKISTTSGSITKKVSKT